jgi:predicted Ser/Thr protein kinase
MEELSNCFIKFDHLELHKQTLGKGGFGKVFKGEFDSSFVAIKEVEQFDEERFVEEVKIS